MRLIGLSGLKTSGKDATYQAIRAAEPNLNVQRVAFADKLKIAAAKAIGFADDSAIELMDGCKEYWDFEIADNGRVFHKFSGREYLQWFGTEAGREVFGQEFWVDLVLPMPRVGVQIDLKAMDHNKRKLIERYHGVDVLVVTDARFENEAKRIKDLGGEMWEIVRPGLEGDGHASEKSLPADMIDYTIINDGTLDELAEKVKATLYSHV